MTKTPTVVMTMTMIQDITNRGVSDSAERQEMRTFSAMSLQQFVRWTWHIGNMGRCLRVSFNSEPFSFAFICILTFHTILSGRTRNQMQDQKCPNSNLRFKSFLHVFVLQDTLQSNRAHWSCLQRSTANVGKSFLDNTLRICHSVFLIKHILYVYMAQDCM